MNTAAVHQAYPTDFDTPTDADGDRLLPEHRQMIDAALKAKDPIDKMIRLCVQFYRGRQWPSNTPKHIPTPVNNKCFTVVETMLPAMLGGDPRFGVMAWSKESEPIANVLNRYLEYKWEDLGLPGITYRWVKTSLIAALGIVKTFVDYDKRGGLGDIAVEEVDPINLFIDPDTKDLYKGRYYFTKIPTPLGEVERKYPEKRGKIRASKKLEAGSMDMKFGRNSADTSADNWRADKQKEAAENASLVDVVELWVRDDTMMPVDLDAYAKMDAKMEAEMGHSIMDHFNQNGAWPEGVEMTKLYPSWRVITCVGDLILADRPSPFDHPRLPFTFLPAYPSPNCAWPMSPVEQIIPLQKRLNKTESQVIAISDFAANTPWVYDRNAGVDRRALNNLPGGAIEKNPGADVHRAEAGQVPPYLFRAIDQVSSDIDTVAGVHDVTQGRKPAGITAATAIAELEESALRRVRGLVRYLLQPALAEIGQNVIDLTVQHYNWQEVFPVVGEDGAMVYNTYDPDDVRGAMPADPGFQWKVRCIADSTMPVSRVARASEALQLYINDAIDRPALLKAYDYPDRLIIDERMSADELLNSELGQMLLESGDPASMAALAPALPGAPPPE